MSILIKGMEMPNKKNGAVLIIYPNGDAVFEDGYHYKAVPVPPHGRLIDADAVEKQIDYVANIDWNKKVGASGGMLAALEIVEDAPTIIPADEENE